MKLTFYFVLVFGGSGMCLFLLLFYIFEMAGIGNYIY